MPGFEIFGEDERREVQDVLETGVLFRYGFEQAREGHFKALTFEENLGKTIGAAYCHLCSSGTAALSIALEIEKDRVLGVVYDPTRLDMFWALRGQGAHGRD